MHSSKLFNTSQAVRHLRRSDPRLALLIKHVGPLRMTLRPAASPFEALLRAIIHQQLSGKAAATIHGRLLDLFSEGLTPEHLLAMSEQTLHDAGLSRNKLLAVRDLAIKTLDGSVPDFRVMATLTDDEIIERLTIVRGIGRWSAEMLLMFNLGRPDVLPVDDLGIRKGFQLVYGMKRLPAAVTLHRAARAWQPYRSAASWYLWQALDTPL
jgi:DNA-3-methyladenine glycosylase II